MTKSFIKIFLTIGILGYLTIRIITWPFQHIDFPCSFSINEKELTVFLLPDSFEIKDLIVFISVFPEHSAGGGCFLKSVDENEIIIYDNYRFLLSERGFTFDSKLIEIGDSIVIEKRIENMDLWWTYKKVITIKNNGEFCSLNSYDENFTFEYPRYFISGYDKTIARINYFTLIIYLSLLIYLVTILRKIKKKKHIPPTRGAANAGC